MNTNPCFIPLSKLLNVSKPQFHHLKTNHLYFIQLLQKLNKIFKLSTYPGTHTSAQLTLILINGRYMIPLLII